ncbi:MAG: TolC family protein [Bacteroidales bacterium]|nr:TolC family protein [Bacteroidales bacterium]
MKKVFLISIASLLLLNFTAKAQYKSGQEPDFALEGAQADSTVVLTLEDALKIALNENISVKIAGKEIQRTEYAKKGTYASLFPQINATGSYQRTLIKNDIRSMMGDSDLSRSMTNTKIGNSNSFSAGVSAAMPIINSQLWTSIKISGLGVETAVEKARSSKIEMVSQVKQAYLGALLAKEAFNVYRDVYENAVENFAQIERKYQAQKASEMEYLRAKTTVSNAIPNVFNAESSIILALWQLKAVIGIDLDTDIDVTGEIDDYAEHMFYDIHQHDSIDVSLNSTIRQLDLQAEQLLKTVKLQKLAYVPTLSISAAFQYSSVANDPIEILAWFPYSYAGISLSIPICSGGKRLNDVRQAKNQYEQLQLQTTNTERQLKIAVKNYLITMETNMKSYYSAGDAVESAQKSYDIVARSYEIGRSTLTDLNDAQLALTQSRLAKSQAVYNFMVAKTNLEQTLGSNEYLDYEEVTEE